MIYQPLLIAHAACIALILVAILVRRNWLKPIAVMAGAVALWLPLFAMFDTLGRPNPYPPKGTYRMLASKFDEPTGTLYVFVDSVAKDLMPRVYRMEFDRGKYRRLQESESDYTQRVLQIGSGQGSDFELVYIDYEPPDLLKDEFRRGYIERPDE